VLDLRPLRYGHRHIGGRNLLDRLLNLYFTLGQQDFVVISEMPDAQAATVLAFVASGGGGIENSVTTQAFTTAEAKALFERAGKIAGGYKPMGAS
jgi:uncharacterized protein with GYD domain